jgi:hypothetical protein
VIRPVARMGGAGPSLRQAPGRNGEVGLHPGYLIGRSRASLPKVQLHLQEGNGELRSTLEHLIYMQTWNGSTQHLRCQRVT